MICRCYRTRRSYFTLCWRASPRRDLPQILFMSFLAAFSRIRRGLFSKKSFLTSLTKMLWSTTRTPFSCCVEPLQSEFGLILRDNMPDMASQIQGRSCVAVHHDAWWWRPWGSLSQQKLFLYGGRCKSSYQYHEQLIYISLVLWNCHNWAASRSLWRAWCHVLHDGLRWAG